VFGCQESKLVPLIWMSHFGSESDRKVETASVLAAIFIARYWQPLCMQRIATQA
jgi:hypothetical protein